MDQDALIIREYREAFEKFARNGIIDLDNKLKLAYIQIILPDGRFL